MVSETTRKAPRRKPEAAFRMIDGQGIVAVPGRSEVHVLNGVGARVWELLDGQRDADEIAREIEKEYEVSPEKAMADVADFLQDLSAKGMLE